MNNTFESLIDNQLFKLKKSDDTFKNINSDYDFSDGNICHRIVEPKTIEHENSTTVPRQRKNIPLLFCRTYNSWNIIVNSRKL